MIEGRIWCDKCGESEPLEATELSYNGIKFHNGDQFISYSVRKVYADGRVAYKDILICKKCKDALHAAVTAVQDEFFKEIK